MWNKCSDILDILLIISFTEKYSNFNLSKLCPILTSLQSVISDEIWKFVKQLLAQKIWNIDLRWKYHLTQFVKQLLAQKICSKDLGWKYHLISLYLKQYTNLWILSDRKTKEQGERPICVFCALFDKSKLTHKPFIHY